MTSQNHVFTAVREFATSFCMDWPVVGTEPSSESGGQGALFVLDVSGLRIVDAPLTAPGDQAADAALHELGWRRCGGWTADDFGRPTAQVIAVGASTSIPRQAGRDGLGSLAEEATLHLG